MGFLENRAADGVQDGQSIHISPAGKGGNREGDLALATRDHDLDDHGRGVRLRRSDFLFRCRPADGFRSRVHPRHRPVTQRPRRKIEMTARWYIVHAYSNFEKKVAEDIEHKAKQKGLSDQIEQIVVPTEKVVEVRR